MQVHNYYSDTMANLYRFLNTYVLSNHNTVRSIHYNLENAAEAMPYRDYSKLPSMVISYDNLDSDDSNPLAPRTFQLRSDLTDINIDQVPAISNYTKGVNFYVQLKSYKLSINIIIKSSSQLQALNIKHDILESLPIGRLLNYKELEFISFFELDSSLLIPSVNDIVNDDIGNLFLRQDGLGSISRMFPLLFAPTVQMSSSPSVQMDDISQGSFQTSFSLEMVVREPSKLITDDSRLNRDIGGNTVSSDSITSVPLTGVVVPIYDNYMHVSKYIDASNTYTLYSFDPTLLVNDYTAPDASVFKGAYIGTRILFEYDLGKGHMFSYSTGSTVTILDNGAHLADAVITGTTLSGTLADGTIFTTDLIWIDYQPLVSTITVLPTALVKVPQIKDVYSMVTNIPPFRSTLDLANTVITSVDILEISTGVITTEAVTVSFLPDGSFSISVTSIPVTVNGMLNRTSSKFEVIQISNILFAVLTITINPTFKINPYGANIIQSISMGINDTTTSIYPSMDNYTKILDSTIRSNINFLVLLSGVTATATTGAHPFQFTLSVDPSTMILTMNPRNFKEHLLFKGVELKTGFSLNIDLSTPTLLIFNCTSMFKVEFLDNISNPSPLFFGLSKI